MGINHCNISGVNSEKFCLKWNEFEENIRHSFQAFRHQQKLFDVTLATDDGHQIEAHRVILSSGSDFFSDVFTKCVQSNMLVYLKGILKSELEKIIDFLYNGETFVTQEELNSFLVTAQELKVKGLQTVDHNITNIESKPNFEEPEFTKQSLISLIKTESRRSKVFSNNELIPVEDDDKSDIAIKNLDLDEKLERMIEGSQGLWKCIVCNKTSNRKANIMNHAETHLQGEKHSCHICMQTYSTRVGVKTHINDVHSKLYSCMMCGRTDMNKNMLRKTHKQNCNGTPQEQ